VSRVLEATVLLFRDQPQRDHLLKDQLAGLRRLSLWVRSSSSFVSLGNRPTRITVPGFAGSSVRKLCYLLASGANVFQVESFFNFFLQDAKKVSVEIGNVMKIGALKNREFLLISYYPPPFVRLATMMLRSEMVSKTAPCSLWVIDACIRARHGDYP
jgi:hypothetical protein